MNVKDIIRVTGGVLLSGDPDISVDTAKVSTDSRTLRKGDFFIALKGPNFDGNVFLDDAFQKGALGCIVTNYRAGSMYPGRIVIRVEDSTAALGAIAHAVRAKFGGPVIAVTGSNGKTTTKEMIWRVLSKKFSVLKNEGTKNNHIGVSQTLLRLTRNHEACILEIGTNNFGEIGHLAAMTKPGIAVITNIGLSHLEAFRDLKGVFREKAAVLERLERGDLAVLNGDDKSLSAVKTKKFKIITFGFGKSNSYRVTSFSCGPYASTFTVNNKLAFELNIMGVHNILNSLAAIAVGSYLGVSYGAMKDAIRGCVAASSRLNVKSINGINIIDDSYNSNPGSMKCALETLKSFPGAAKWIVSGDMLELGKKSVYFHKALGSSIAACGAQGLFTLGGFSRHTASSARECGMRKNSIWHCRDHNEAADALRKVAREKDVILIKGSRGMRMEKVLELFARTPNPKPGTPDTEK